MAIFARNGIWHLETFYSMPMLGTILTTYNCMLKTRELAESVLSEAPKVVLYESCYEEKAAEFQKQLPDTVFISLDGENPLGTWRYEDALAGESWQEPWADVDMESICMLLHTGGTTGHPKAAMISYRAVILNTVGQIIDYGITNQDIAYVSFPFFHTASWNSALPLLVCGGKVILKRKFDAAKALQMVDEEKLTMLAGSPSVFRRMSLTEEFGRCSFKSLRALRCGSATPTRDLMELYWKKGEQIIFYNGYGMTEAGSGTLSLPASSMSRELELEKAGSVGKPMIFAQMKIVDENGKELPAGCKGELLVKNGNMFSGYWSKPEATAQAVEEGWLHTGDIVQQDEDGFYFICGRKKNMYISGGENIYPPEIETFILDHPAVADAYVFGVPDCDWGEVGKAIVVVREGMHLSKAQLLEYLAGHLSTIKIPKYVQFVEAVPRNEAGKIVGQAIRERYCFPGEAEPL